MIPDHFRRLRSAIETGYHAEHIRAEALESLDEIQAHWKPGECEWRMVDRQGAYYQPSCDQKQMVLKIFGSRFCPLCGSPLTLKDDY
jgi:hypothetical protein